MPVHKGEITERMTNIVALFNLIRHETIRYSRWSSPQCCGRCTPPARVGSFGFRLIAKLLLGLRDQEVLNLLKGSENLSSRVVCAAVSIRVTGHELIVTKLRRIPFISGNLKAGGYCYCALI